MIGRLLRGVEERRRSPWYRNGAYVNIDDDPAAPPRALPIFALLRWRLSPVAPPAVAGAPDRPCEVRPLAPDSLAPPARGLKVAWLGHASLYVVSPRARLVIDPLFGGPPLIRRLAPAPIAAEDLPPPDALLLTHNHYDHFHPASIEAVRRRSPALRALVPSGLGATVRRRFGIAETRALEWWEPVAVGDATVSFVPARHWSKRGFGDTRQSHWGGFAIESGGRRLLVAGDTGMGRHFDLIAARFSPFDAAILPIGAYSPRWFMRERHMDPPEAVAAARTLRASVLLPYHWGSFRLSDEPLGEPPLYVRRAAETAGQPLDLWLPGEVREV